MSYVDFIIKNNNIEVIFPEKLDITNSQEVLFAIQNKVSEVDPDKIIFNLEKCDFISSAGIGILANITRQALDKKRKTVITKYNEAIENILEMTDILNYIGTE